MSLSQFYFSFEDRISRSAFWFKFWLPYMAMGVAVSLIDVFTGNINEDGGIGTFSIIYMLLTLWPLIAVSVKRLHDRNRSGWFFLLGMIPIAGIWITIELLFLGGTKGENWHGSDPRKQNSTTSLPV